MISMQMGNKYYPYTIRIDAIPIHANEAGCPAVDQELTTAVFNQNAALQPAAASEGVAAAKKLNFHIAHNASPG
jgi:hypothetical protein